ncbi:hypothetical protein F5879DRAFT_939597 [Lentinula edodes]|nr:hypothetical protein F5879DRAFT_939597 [Lentinula edodes]
MLTLWKLALKSDSTYRFSAADWFESTTIASRRFWKLARDLPRKLTCILTQLRTGHIPLQKHLHRIHRADTLICPCCEQQPETVFHYLFPCPAHRRARDCFRIRVPRTQWNMSSLLTCRSTLPQLFHYIDDTKRFHHIIGDR